MIFLEYFLPSGRTAPRIIERPADIEAVATQLAGLGVQLSIEVLRTALVSMTAERDKGAEVDVLAHEFARNVPESVQFQVDVLVERAWIVLMADAMGAS